METRERRTRRWEIRRKKMKPDSQEEILTYFSLCCQIYVFFSLSMKEERNKRKRKREGEGVWMGER